MPTTKPMKEKLDRSREILFTASQIEEIENAAAEEGGTFSAFVRSAAVAKARELIRGLSVQER